VPLGGDGRNDVDELLVENVPVVVPKSYVQVAAEALVGTTSRMPSVDARLRRGKLQCCPIHAMKRRLVVWLTRCDIRSRPPSGDEFKGGHPGRDPIEAVESGRLPRNA
jgi:hypothetical protein